MTKQQFLNHVRALYVVGNMADSSDDPRKEEWTHAEMAGEACCSALDAMLHRMRQLNVLTSEEHQAFYDTL